MNQKIQYNLWFGGRRVKTTIAKRYDTFFKKQVTYY